MSELENVTGSIQEQYSTLPGKETANTETMLAQRNLRKVKRQRKSKSKQNTSTEMTERDNAADNCILPVKRKHIAVSVEGGFRIGEVKDRQ